MKYTTAVFDLDGTITDSCPGILNSIRYALKKRGIDAVSYTHLTLPTILLV